jgi:hypothetical protein
MNIDNRRRGFSLIAVIVISLAGMALLGGLFYTFQSMSGRTQNVTSRSTTYNMLQDGVEQGKAFLKDVMMDETEALRRKAGTILSVSDLLICPKGSTTTPIGHIVKSADVHIGADKGVLNVYIYDMQYKKEDIGTGITPAARAELPPMMLVGGKNWEEIEYEGDDDDSAASINIGAYTIRATFTSGNGEVKTIETAVVQAVGK